VLLERGSRDPRGHALDSAIEIAARKPELVGRLASALDELPPASVPLQLPAKLVAAINPRPPELTQLLERWRTSGSGGLKRAAADEELAELTLDADGLVRALEAFIAFYIYNRLLPQIDERLTRYADAAHAERLDGDLRQLIRAQVRIRLRDVDPLAVDWSGAE